MATTVRSKSPKSHLAMDVFSCGHESALRLVQECICGSELALRYKDGTELPLVSLLSNPGGVTALGLRAGV